MRKIACLPRKEGDIIGGFSPQVEVDLYFMNVYMYLHIKNKSNPCNFLSEVEKVP